MDLRCEDCSLARGCKSNKIDGQGPDKADIMIVGDAPGYTDDQTGEVFQGDMGAKLDFLLKQIGLKRSKVFLTYAVKCKPYRMDKIKRDAIAGCRKHLFREILEQRPKVIIPMGKIALEVVSGLKDIDDERGFFGDFELAYDVKMGKEKVKKIFKCKTMPTKSLFAALSRWEYDSIIKHDLKKAVLFVQTGELPKKPKLTFDFITDMKKMEEVTKKLCEADHIAFDFETTGLSFMSNKVIMAGFCMTPGHAYVFPTHEYTAEEMKKKWTKEEKEFATKVVNPFVKKNSKKIWECIGRVLKSNAKKTAQNGKFDYKFARSMGVIIKNWDFDTAIAHALVDENKPHNLTFMMEWFGIHYGNYEKLLYPYVNKTKDKKKPYSHIPPMLCGLYLAMDCDGTHKLRPKLFKELKKEGFVDLFRKQQMPLIRMMSDLEYRGIKIDVQQLQKLSKDFAAILADIQTKMVKITKNKTFNPNSTADLRNYFEDIGAPLTKKTPGGQWSTDADVLEELAGKKKWAKVPKLILEQRALTKLKGTYLDGKDGKGGILSWVDKNYMVHTSYNAHTPRTGRMSCEDPPLQTIPRPNPKYPSANIRQLFVVSKKNWVMFSVDFKQLEMRIAAFLSRDMVMIREIMDNVDIHSRNAVMFGTKLGILPADMTEDKFVSIVKWKEPKDRELTEKEKAMKQLCAEYTELRVLAKSLGFGLNYGMEASTLAKQYGRDEEEIQEMIDLYFDKYAALALWREEQKQLSLDKGVLVLPETGRKRRFTDASDWFNSPLSEGCFKREMDLQGIYRQAMNFPIQGFANEVFTQGKLKLYGKMKKEKLKSRIMLSLHDGVLGEGPMEEMLAIKKAAKDCMERFLGEGKKYQVHLGIDFELYDRWGGNKLELKAA